MYDAKYYKMSEEQLKAAVESLQLCISVLPCLPQRSAGIFGLMVSYCMIELTSDIGNFLSAHIITIPITYAVIRPTL